MISSRPGLSPQRKERNRHKIVTAFVLGTRRLYDFVHDNPMAAGAVALAVGVAIGLSVPRTEIEDGTMGETRDRAWQKASEIAQNLKDNVSQKMATAAENIVGESMKNAATTTPEPMGRA